MLGKHGVDHRHGRHGQHIPGLGGRRAGSIYIVSSGLLLRISEATTVHLVDQGGVAKAQFEGTKSRRGTNQSSIGRWTKKWLQFIAFWRASHGHHPDRPASFRGVAGLHKALRELLDKGGGRCAHIRWHGFKRFEAAQLQGLRLPLSSIQIYGG